MTFYKNELRSTKIAPFLADTWWYGLSNRLSDENFKRLAELRKDQGFTTVQLVVGIPPEVGAANRNAMSTVGAAWTLDGEISTDYLRFARSRISLLNEIGLGAIIYGAWGHQIDWLGEEGMMVWWKNVIQTVDDLAVIYCLTGESNLWIGNTGKLLPDKTTGDTVENKFKNTFNSRLADFGLFRFAKAAKRLFITPLKKRFLFNRYKHQREMRIKQWSNVLEFVSSLTQKPILVHPVPGEISHDTVVNPNLLSAITVQTGHDIATKNLLWQLPKKLREENLNAQYINLEPWYEGIKDQFGVQEQLFAYWSSMLAGASAYCYGAHGIWNVGDGNFLAHWGRQTFDQAIQLQTPQLVGASHKIFMNVKAYEWAQVTVKEVNSELTEIRRAASDNRFIVYYPNLLKADTISKGRYFCPLTGEFISSLPESGQLVVIATS